MLNGSFPAVSLLFEYQRCELVRSEKLAGYGLYLAGCYGVNAVEEGIDVASVAVVEEIFPEVKGEALAVVAGHGQLAFELSFCRGEGRGGQRPVHHAVQLAADELSATLYVVRVAAEIDGP